MTKTLAEEIDARKRFLEKVVEFVSVLVAERGEVIKKTEDSTDGNVVRELRDFAGFSFRVNTAHVGGSDISISYRLDKKRDYATVLIACWFSPLFDPKVCRVQYFDKRICWESALAYVMENKELVVGVIDRKGTEFEKLRKVEEEEMFLRNEALRLGLL